VLIYDRFCRDIISPILKLHELRKKGVTLHMLLDTERDAIPDVPAIYFVEPTRANLERVVSDCAKELYSSVHLNFAYPLSREALEYLARASVEAGCTSMVRVASWLLRMTVSADCSVCRSPRCTTNTRTSCHWSRVCSR
jgi:hypothetical protein